MKKYPFALLVSSSLIIAFLSLNSISFLSKLSSPPAGLDINQLSQGHFLQLFFLKDFWFDFPSLLSIRLYLDPNALLLVACLAGSALFASRFRLKTSPAVTGLVLLLTGLIPFSIGLLALWGNGIAEQAGLWLSFMLTGILYSSATCAIYCTYQLLFFGTPEMKNEELRPFPR